MQVVNVLNYFDSELYNLVKKMQLLSSLASFVFA